MLLAAAENTIRIVNCKQNMLLAAAEHAIEFEPEKFNLVNRT